MGLVISILVSFTASAFTAGSAVGTFVASVIFDLFTLLRLYLGRAFDALQILIFLLIIMAVGFALIYEQKSVQTVVDIAYDSSIYPFFDLVNRWVTLPIRIGYEWIALRWNDFWYYLLICTDNLIQSIASIPNIISFNGIVASVGKVGDFLFDCVGQAFVEICSLRIPYLSGWLSNSNRAFHFGWKFVKDAASLLYYVFTPQERFPPYETVFQLVEFKELCIKLAEDLNGLMSNVLQFITLENFLGPVVDDLAANPQVIDGFDTSILIPPELSYASTILSVLGRGLNETVSLGILAIKEGFVTFVTGTIIANDCYSCERTNNCGDGGYCALPVISAIQIDCNSAACASGACIRYSYPWYIPPFTYRTGAVKVSEFLYTYVCDRFEYDVPLLTGVQIQRYSLLRYPSDVVTDRKYFSSLGGSEIETLSRWQVNETMLRQNCTNPSLSTPIRLDETGAVIECNSTAPKLVRFLRGRVFLEQVRAFQRAPQPVATNTMRLMFNPGNNTFALNEMIMPSLDKFQWKRSGERLIPSPARVVAYKVIELLPTTQALRCEQCVNLLGRVLDIVLRVIQLVLELAISFYNFIFSLFNSVTVAISGGDPPFPYADLIDFTSKFTLIRDLVYPDRSRLYCRVGLSNLIIVPSIFAIIRATGCDVAGSTTTWAFDVFDDGILGCSASIYGVVTGTSYDSTTDFALEVILTSVLGRGFSSFINWIVVASECAKIPSVINCGDVFRASKVIENNGTVSNRTCDFRHSLNITSLLNATASMDSLLPLGILTPANPITVLDPRVCNFTLSQRVSIPALNLTYTKNVTAPARCDCNFTDISLGNTARFCRCAYSDLDNVTQAGFCSCQYTSIANVTRSSDIFRVTQGFCFCNFTNLGDVTKPGSCNAAAMKYNFGTNETALRARYPNITLGDLKYAGSAGCLRKWDECMDERTTGKVSRNAYEDFRPLVQAAAVIAEQLVDYALGCPFVQMIGCSDYQYNTCPNKISCSSCGTAGGADCGSVVTESTKTAIIGARCLSIAGSCIIGQRVRSNGVLIMNSPGAMASGWIGAIAKFLGDFGESIILVFVYIGQLLWNIVCGLRQLGTCLLEVIYYGLRYVCWYAIYYLGGCGDENLDREPGTFEQDTPSCKLIGSGINWNPPPFPTFDFDYDSIINYTKKRRVRQFSNSEFMSSARPEPRQIPYFLTAKERNKPIQQSSTASVPGSSDPSITTTAVSYLPAFESYRQSLIFQLQQFEQYHLSLQNAERLLTNEQYQETYESTGTDFCIYHQLAPRACEFYYSGNEEMLKSMNLNLFRSREFENCMCNGTRYLHTAAFLFLGVRDMELLESCVCSWTLPSQGGREVFLTIQPALQHMKQKFLPYMFESIGIPKQSSCLQGYQNIGRRQYPVLTDGEFGSYSAATQHLSIVALSSASAASATTTESSSVPSNILLPLNIESIYEEPGSIWCTLVLSQSLQMKNDAGFQAHSAQQGWEAHDTSEMINNPFYFLRTFSSFLQYNLLDILQKTTLRTVNTVPLSAQSGATGEPSSYLHLYSPHDLVEFTDVEQQKSSTENNSGSKKRSIADSPSEIDENMLWLHKKMESVSHLSRKAMRSYVDMLVDAAESFTHYHHFPNSHIADTTVVYQDHEPPAFPTRAQNGAVKRVLLEPSDDEKHIDTILDGVRLLERWLRRHPIHRSETEPHHPLPSWIWRRYVESTNCTFDTNLPHSMALMQCIRQYRKTFPATHSAPPHRESHHHHRNSHHLTRRHHHVVAEELEAIAHGTHALWKRQHETKHADRSHLDPSTWWNSITNTLYNALLPSYEPSAGSLYKRSTAYDTSVPQNGYESGSGTKAVKMGWLDRFKIALQHPQFDVFATNLGAGISRAYKRHGMDTHLTRLEGHWGAVFGSAQWKETTVGRTLLAVDHMMSNPVRSTAAEDFAHWWNGSREFVSDHGFVPREMVDEVQAVRKRQFHTDKKDKGNFWDFHQDNLNLRQRRQTVGPFVALGSYLESFRRIHSMNEFQSFDAEYKRQNSQGSSGKRSLSENNNDDESVKGGQSKKIPMGQDLLQNHPYIQQQRGLRKRQNEHLAAHIKLPLLFRQQEAALRALVREHRYTPSEDDVREFRRHMGCRWLLDDVAANLVFVVTPPTSSAPSPSPAFISTLSEYEHETQTPTNIATATINATTSTIATETTQNTKKKTVSSSFVRECTDLFHEHRAGMLPVGHGLVRLRINDSDGYVIDAPIPTLLEMKALYLERGHEFIQTALREHVFSLIRLRAGNRRRRMQLEQIMEVYKIYDHAPLEDISAQIAAQATIDLVTPVASTADQVGLFFLNVGVFLYNGIFGQNVSYATDLQVASAQIVDYFDAYQREISNSDGTLATNIGILKSYFGVLTDIVICDIPNDFDGTNWYNPFCLPFLPEGLFGWLEPLPTTVFPEQIAWPDCLIKQRFWFDRRFSEGNGSILNNDRCDDCVVQDPSYEPGFFATLYNSSIPRCTKVPYEDAYGLMYLRSDCDVVKSGNSLLRTEIVLFPYKTTAPGNPEVSGFNYLDPHGGCPRNGSWDPLIFPACPQSDWTPGEYLSCFTDLGQGNWNSPLDSWFFFLSNVPRAWNWAFERGTGLAGVLRIVVFWLPIPFLLWIPEIVLLSIPFFLARVIADGTGLKAGLSFGGILTFLLKTKVGRAYTYSFWILLLTWIISRFVAFPIIDTDVWDTLIVNFFSKTIFEFSLTFLLGLEDTANFIAQKAILRTGEPVCPDLFCFYWTLSWWIVGWFMLAGILGLIVYGLVILFRVFLLLLSLGGALFIFIGGLFTAYQFRVVSGNVDDTQLLAQSTYNRTEVFASALDDSNTRPASESLEPSAATNPLSSTLDTTDREEEQQLRRRKKQF
jgi:hypothetical protein